MQKKRNAAEKKSSGQRRAEGSRVVVSVDAPAWIVALAVGAIAGALIALALISWNSPRRASTGGGTIIYMSVEPSRPESIESALAAAIRHFGRTWHKGTFEHAVKVLALGERLTGIDHKDVIAIMATESEMKVSARGRNRDGSVDYGLTQQNSAHIAERYAKAAKLLDDSGVWHDGRNKYDIGLNIIACYLYLRDIRRELGNEATHHAVIKSYNAGVNGMRLGRGERYYTKFTKNKVSILTMAAM